MTDFEDDWKPRWLIEKEFPGCVFATYPNGYYRTGRPKYEWVARRGAQRVISRDSMRLTSKEGNDYYVVATQDRQTPRYVASMRDVYAPG